MSWLKLLVSLCVFYLVGCSKQATPDGLMHTYIERVANVIDETATWEATTPPSLPPTRLRLQNAVEIREGLIDVLVFRKCDLLPLIAERNSSLGKLAAPSQRMIYEIKFIQQLSTCLAKIDADPELDLETKQRVHQVYDTKLSNLPTILWNAVYTGQEIETSLAANLAPLPLSMNSHETLLRHLQALSSFVTQALTAPQTVQSALLTDIESTYEALYRDPMGTPIIKSLLLLEGTLNTVADLIEKRLIRRPMCFYQMSNPKADILKNVFMQFYAAQIQPYMASVHKIGDSWLSSHEKMLMLLPVPREMQSYTAQVFMKSTETSIWRRYITARDRHTAAWKSILEQCNLLPKAPE